MDNLPINEVVALIQDFSPSELDRLKKKFPDSKNVFQAGLHLGETDDKLLIIKMSTCISGLRIIIDKCKEHLPKLKKRITGISRLSLISQIVVALSSATIISTFQKRGEGYESLVFVSSILALIGSVLGIIVQHISNSIYNNSSYFNVYTSLNEHYIQAEQHLLDLEVFAMISPLEDNNKEEIRQIIKYANSTSVQIRKFISI